MDRGQKAVFQGGLDEVQAQRASLFANREPGSFFEPLVRAPIAPPNVVGTGRAAGLMDLIARAEAGKAGYDAVQYGARIKPSKRPTDMTLGEIYDWIDATPGQPHAIGRYQFIPPTLRRLAAASEFGRDIRFTPLVQDKLAMILLEEAGLTRLENNAITRTQFMNNIAKIWAGFPNSTGRSHYHGYAGNKATMTWARFQKEMVRLYPNAPV
jgi:muramidase (phage lysozyme)